MRHSRSIWRWALALAAALAAGQGARAQVTITNGAAVNVTPTSFSIVATVAPASATASIAVSVFADSLGVTNLAGQVGVELYPLNTGALGTTNRFQRQQSQAALQKQTAALGIVYARVSDCLPNTTYYYRVKVTDTNGQTATWPGGAPAAVKTARENAFAPQSSQLLVILNAANATGSVLTLSDSNSATILAAVVGDGAPPNQAFFSINDLTSLIGNTNFAPLGNQTFTATLLGSTGTGFSQNYALFFSTNFMVSQSAQFSVGQASALVAFGQDFQRAGSSGSVPLTVNSVAPLTSFSFVLNVPTNLFTSLFLQADSPLVSQASLQVLSANSLRLTVQAVPGTNFHGAAQVAQLNYTLATNDNSAFVTLAPQSLVGTNVDFSAPAMYAQPGRIIVIGSQPILDAQMSGSSRLLVLYGIPGNSYQIQASTNLKGAVNWTNFALIPLTTDFHVISNLNSSAPAVFYRAYH